MPSIGETGSEPSPSTLDTIGAQTPMRIFFVPPFLISQPDGKGNLHLHQNINDWSATRIA
jgi:hypothetical protein